MSFLRPLAKLSVLAVFASAAMSPALAAPEVCEAARAPKINIIPKTDGIEYDYGQRLAEIQSVKIDTPNPYGMHSSSITQGFMQGQIAVKQEVKFDFYPIKGSGDYCVYYDEINVEIEIDPKIVIAKEIKRDRCMFDAVLEHEMKHINADRMIVNEGAKNLANQVYAQIKQNGMAMRVNEDNAQSAAQAMGASVMEVIKQEYQAMGEHRMSVQSGIDSREEYDRVAALCPHFHKKKRNLYKQALRSKQE